MKKIILPIFFLLLLAMSFFAGNHFGANNYLLANSANRALVLAAELRMLRANNTADLIYVKEIELSSEFRFHDQYTNSNFKWMFPSIAESSERNMKQAVKYRLEFPYNTSDIEVPISHGSYTFQHKFAEHPNSESISLDVEITGSKITVTNNNELSAWPKGVVEEGQLFLHSSKKWIITHNESDKQAIEVGGCTDGPTVVDLIKKVYWTC